jgi:hypothetical protein
MLTNDPKQPPNQRDPTYYRYLNPTKSRATRTLTTTRNFTELCYYVNKRSTDTIITTVVYSPTHAREISMK